MSDSKHIKATLSEIPLGGLSLRVLCSGILGAAGKIEQLADLDYDEDVEDLIQEDNKYLIADGKLYELVKYEEVGDYFQVAKRNGQGHIEVDARFFNGGTFFAEVAEGAIKDLEKEKK